MAERTVSVKLKADVAQYMASMRAAGRATSDLEKAGLDLKVALNGEEEALGRVRVAAARLEELRKTGKASVAQLAQAEEQLAAAHRSVEIAQDRVVVATKRYEEAQKAASEADQQRLGDFERETEKVAKRANAAFSATLFAGLAGGGGAAAGIGTLIGAAGIGGVTIALAAMSAAALSADEDVSSAFADMRASAVADARAIAAPLEGTLVTSLERLRGAVHELAPELARGTAAAAPGVEKLTTGLINMARTATPGIVRMAQTSGPVFTGLQRLLEDTGTGFAGFADEIVAESDDIGQNVEQLGQLIETVLPRVGGIIANLGGNTTAVNLFVDLIDEGARVLENLTEEGGLAMNVLNGFTGTTTGVLQVLNGLLSVLNMVPDELGNLVGMLLVARTVMKAFGVDIKDAFRGADGAVGGFRSRAAQAIGVLGALGVVAGVMATKVEHGQTSVEGLSKALVTWISTGRTSGDLARLFGDNLQDMNDAFTILTASGLSGALEKVTDFAAGLLGSESRLDDATSRVQQLDAALSNMVRNGQVGEAATVLQRISQQTGLSVQELTNLMPGYKAALDGAGASTSGTGQAIADLAKRAQDAKDRIDGLTTALDNLVSPQLDAREAARALEAAIDDATKALQDNGRTLDVTSEKGRSNQEALDGIASATNEAVQSMVKMGASQQDVAARMQQGRDAFISFATQMGMSKASAEDLATSLGLVSSKDWKVNVGANVRTAQDRLNEFMAWAGSQTAEATVFANADPAHGAVQNWQNVTQKTEGRTTTTTYTDPATGAVITWKRTTDATGAVTVTRSWTDPATGAVIEWKRMADGTWATTNVRADTTAAEAAINSLTRTRYANVVVTYTTGAGGISNSMQYGPRAAGGIDIPGAIPMANGGLLKRIPHLATVVPPNLPRLIGDNMKVPEAFIPLDPNSPRSRSILNQANQAMGFSSLEVQAAQEMLAQLASGKGLYEDFSFKGMSDNAAAYNDALAEKFRAMNPGVDFSRFGSRSAVEKYLRGVVASGSPHASIRNGRAVAQTPSRISAGNVTTYTFNVPNYVGSVNDLVRVLRNAVRDKGGNVQKVLGKGA